MDQSGKLPRKNDSKDKADERNRPSEDLGGSNDYQQIEESPNMNVSYNTSTSKIYPKQTDSNSLHSPIEGHPANENLMNDEYDEAMSILTEGQLGWESEPALDSNLQASVSTVGGIDFSTNSPEFVPYANPRAHDSITYQESSNIKRRRQKQAQGELAYVASDTSIVYGRNGELSLDKNSSPPTAYSRFPAFTVQSESDLRGLQEERVGNTVKNATIATHTEQDKNNFAKLPSLVRGASLGRSMKAPLTPHLGPGFKYIRCQIELINAEENCICFPPWTPREQDDMRRIVCIIRKQTKNKVQGIFEIVPPESQQSSEECIEVSCLRCLSSKRYPSYDNEHIICQFEEEESKLDNCYYITSVEVVKIVKFLANLPHHLSKREERKESGRIRSNLTAFWLEKPINSIKLEDGVRSGKTNADFKNELAGRIIGYQTRKPRDFDRYVRILEWRTLSFALRRAMRSYYVEVKEETQ
ncbi:hypothetical protein FOA43_003030 [Brettanomyces nanus]|uniref:DUF7082 domain-containing protein n=1 Tax=Eeniella nana TaxID=13502 RepID=A0A875S1R2_EENNA|nr:uncharacterized protein FOA43_003030 [Brettanomyces nanus]QPG75671.1 hypothetical protein FOA43_003030 [Brettanomyces nanus]